MEKSSVGKYLIRLICSFLTGVVPPDKPESIEFEDIYRLSRLHNVSVLALAAVKKLNEPLPENLKKLWERKASISISQSIVQLHERDVIYSEFEKNRVQYLPLKGCLLKNMYPDITYREMSDLDILIHEKDALRAKEIMKSLGYSCEDFGGFVDDSYYKGELMHVELHYRLLSEYHFEYMEWSYPKTTFLLDPWKNAVRMEQDSCHYVFTDDDLYIYMVVHLAKHFYYSGCGIRQFLDLYFLKRNLNIDHEKIYFELEKYDLKEFCMNAEKLAEGWMSLQDTEPDLTKMEQMIIDFGAYGNRNQSLDKRLNQLHKKSRIPVRVQYYFFRLFPSIHFMKLWYSILDKYPALLPVYWIKRILTKGIRKIPSISNEIKRVNMALDKKEKNS